MCSLSLHFCSHVYFFRCICFFVFLFVIVFVFVYSPPRGGVVCLQGCTRAGSTDALNSSSARCSANISIIALQISNTIFSSSNISYYNCSHCHHHHHDIFLPSGNVTSGNLLVYHYHHHCHYLDLSVVFS